MIMAVRAPLLFDTIKVKCRHIPRPIAKHVPSLVVKSNPTLKRDNKTCSLEGKYETRLEEDVASEIF